MKTDPRAELVPLDVIRVETALSRFPVHRLAKAGIVCIELREADEKGETAVRWEVGYHSKYGQPGPLAYKADTLIVNRRIEEAGKPVSRMIRLGSLKEIAQRLGLGGDTNKVRRALHQNASAYITAKIRYKANDGTERGIEIGDTRYAVVFTGEKLPDGRIADVVHIVLHDFYREILDHALTRPLDYGYLRELPPVSQRLYELLSYRMYAALKHNRPRARLNYAEFCTYAPQIRYAGFGPMRKQMAKVHAPHWEAGYIAGVAFEATTGRDGRPDWAMIYTPGPKAEAEYRAFTQRGGRPVAIEAEPGPESEPTGLERELIDRGVSPSRAAELVRDFPEEYIRAKVEQVDWLREKRPKKVADLGAYLVGAIRDDYAAPAGFETKAQREQREQAERERLRQETEARQRLASERAKEAAERARIAAYWAGLTTERQTALEREALANADPEMVASYRAVARTPVGRMMLSTIRDAHISRILGITATADELDSLDKAG